MISPSEYASAGGRFQKTPQLVGGEKFGCYLSGSVPPRFITMVRDLRTKDILYARDEARQDARSGLRARGWLRRFVDLVRLEGDACCSAHCK